MKSSILPRRRILSFLLVVVLVIGLIPIHFSKTVQAAAPITSPTDVSYGVNFGELYSPETLIYLGQHKHAIALTNKGTSDLMPVYGPVTSRETVETPILWQVMGETEGNPDSMTLMSQYVVDSQPYGGGSSPTWGSSDLNNWLKNTFLSTAFNATESALIDKNLTVNTQGMGVISDNLKFEGTLDTISDCAIYLPWASGNNTGNFNSRNMAWWNLTNPTAVAELTGSQQYKTEFQVGNVEIATSGGEQESKQAYLKPNPSIMETRSQPVWYFTRTPELLGEVVAIDTKGINNVKPAGNSVGVRPIMSLENLKDNVVMITQIENGGDRTDQINPTDIDGYYAYLDFDKTGLPGTNKIFKLTLLDNNLDSHLLTGKQTYHYDETLADGDTVYANAGKSLNIANESTGNGPVLSYKIVNSSGVLVHNGTANSLTSLDMKIRNITNEGNLSEGDYHAYVWVQENNDTISHLASTPLYFKLKVVSIGSPSIHAGSAQRAPGGNTAINFSIDGIKPQDGHYYYLVNPSNTPLDIADFLTGGNKTSYTIGTGQTSAVISLTENIPTGNKVYVIAKNQAGELSGIKEIIITDQAANNPPVAKSAIDQLVAAGSSVSFDAGDIATDPDGDTISITNINTSSTNLSFANVTLSGTTVLVDGLSPGSTSVVVTVTDSQGASVNITVPIKVDPAPPTQEPSVAPASVTMKKGETRVANLQLGLGASGVSGATITSGDTSIATVSPSSVSANGSITIAGIKKGNTQIVVLWSDGSSDTVTVSVTEDTGPPVGTQYTVNYSAGTGGSVSSSSVSNGGKVDKDTVVQITATPSTNYKFLGWTINGAASDSSNPKSITITQNTTIVGNFTYTGSGTGGNTGNGGSSGGGGGGGGGGGRVDGQATGTVTSKSGSGQGSDPLYLAAPFVVDPPRAKKAIDFKNKNSLDSSRITYNGSIRVLATASKLFNVAPVRYDVIIDNAVQVRVVVNEPNLMTEDMYLSGYVKGNAVNQIKNALKKWFTNDIFIIHFDQKGEWGQNVEIAALVPFDKTPTNNLYFYHYNREKNSYSRLSNINYYIDSNNYLRFNTSVAGDIIVSNGPLVKK